MGLSDLKHVSNISSVSAKTSVTKNAKTGTVWKCTVDNLETKVLPSPDSGARYEGLALLIDSNGNLGAFCLVNANPRSSANGGMAAREIWLDTLSTAFLQAEFGTEQASKFTELTVPSAGCKIAFASITGSNPQNANNITPESFSGGCVETTLRDHRVDLMEEILKLKVSLDTLSAPSLATLLLSDYSILSGSLLTWSSGMQVSVSSGIARYKGSEFNHAGGVCSGFSDKQLARVMVDQQGNYSIGLENSTGGTIDSDYNPSGTSPLPTAATPAWTASGTPSTESVANGVLSLAVTSNSRIYTRAGVAGPPASGSTFSAWLQFVSGSPFSVEIDHGSGSSKGGFTVGNGYVQINTSNDRVYFDTTKPFHVRFTLINSTAKLYINGQLVLMTGTPSSGNTNQVRWGYFTSVTGAINIGRIITRAGIALEPAWSDLQGAVLGTVATMTSTFASPVGLVDKLIDAGLTNRREGNLATVSDLLYTGKLPTGYADMRVKGNSTTRIQILAGFRCRSADDKCDIVFNSNYFVDLTNATPNSTTGGRTVPKTSSTTYYLYVGLDSTDSPIAWFDTANSMAGGTPTFPAAYRRGIRQVLFKNLFDEPLLIYNNSADLIDYMGGSLLYLTGGNGYGSVATRIRRFSTPTRNIGDAHTYNDDSIAGTTVFINKNGVYAVTVADFHSAAVSRRVGLSLNVASGSGGAIDIDTINVENMLDVTYTANSTFVNFASISNDYVLEAGDFLAHHSGGQNDGTSANLVKFRVQRVG